VSREPVRMSLIVPRRRLQAYRVPPLLQEPVGRVQWRAGGRPGCFCALVPGAAGVQSFYAVL
jgi:hypothetical protein